MHPFPFKATASGTNNENSQSSNVKQRSEDVTPNKTDNHVTVGEAVGMKKLGTTRTGTSRELRPVITEVNVPSTTAHRVKKVRSSC